MVQLRDPLLCQQKAAATVGSSRNGLQIDIKGQVQAQLIVENALPGWKSGKYEIEQPTPKSIYSDCLPFLLSKRDLSANDTAVDMFGGSFITKRQTIGDPLPDPASSGTCAFNVRGVYCIGGDSDDDNISCDIFETFPNTLDDSSSDGSEAAKRDIDETSTDLLPATGYDGESTLHSLVKRAGAKTREYCVVKTNSHRGAFDVDDFIGVSRSNAGEISYEGFPSSGKVKQKYPDNHAYTFEVVCTSNEFEVTADSHLRLTNPEIDCPLFCPEVYGLPSSGPSSVAHTSPRSHHLSIHVV